MVEPKKGIGLPTLTLYASSYKKYVFICSCFLVYCLVLSSCLLCVVLD